MQAPRSDWIVAPRLPGGEEVHAEAEARFDDDELLASAPTLRQAIAAQENVLCLP
jgi:hypothetical protein